MICIALSLLCVASLAAAPPGPVQAYRSFEEAAEAFRAGNDEQAIALAKALLEVTPERPDLWYILSMSAERLGRLPEAIGAAEKALDLGYVRRARMAYRIARMQARLSHEEAALDWLAVALEARYEDRPGIRDDDAFASLRDNPRFRQMAGLLPPGEITRDQGLRLDLDYLVEEARRMHAGPTRPAFSEAFEAHAGAIRNSIPDMSDLEVLTAMSRLVAILGDGHSAIYGVDEDSSLDVPRGRLPLKFYLFPEGLFIVDGADEFAAYAGDRVVSFGGRPAGEVLADLAPGRGVDNSMTWTWMGPQFYAGALSWLMSVGATESAGSVRLTLEDREGGRSTVTFPAGDFENVRKLRPSPAATGPVPDYLQHVDRNYWMKPMPERSTLYVQFNSVRNMEEESLESFAGRMAEQLKAAGSRNLIIDVRHNNGGNNGLLRPLIRAMVAFEMASAGHEIYVITGRNTFSAAQNFINRVEAWTDAVFVGEPSSSSPNFVGEETNLLLPYSRIRGSISTRYWQDSAPGDERAWIDPDIPVTLSAEDYFAGRDPAMAAILELLPVAVKEGGSPGSR